MQEAKLNLGCGRTLIEGWVNIDNSPSAVLSKLPAVGRLLARAGLGVGDGWSRSIVWHDVTRGLPYPDGSAAKVYSSHMLEHLDRAAGEAVVRECHRVLRPGGVLRIVVPDLAYHARRYLRRLGEPGGAPAGREAHDDFLFNIYGAYLHRRRKGAYHRYMYDWPTLRDVLRDAGFRHLVRQGYQVSLDPELAGLDSRPDESLHVDAVR